MKKISTKKINIGEKEVGVTIYLVEENEEIDFSRVYVISGNDNGDIALIYNSKRGIWGFPGGHPEENETLQETAERECVEEIKYSIKNCEPKFIISNKLDDEKEEFQIICFAKIDEKSEKFIDENESVSKIKFVKIENAQEEIDNFDLWEDILQNYKEWSTNL